MALLTDMHTIGGPVTLDDVARAHAPAGDEFQSGGRRGPAVDVQPHVQGRAQRSPGQADLDPARARVAIVLQRPEQLAPAGP